MNLKNLLYWFCVCCFYIQCSHCNLVTIEDNVVARGYNGSWRGRIFKSRDGRNYFGFRGIRYGTVPGRFEEAVAVFQNETVDALEFGSECPQIRLFDDRLVTETEDCLFVNVYVPQTQKSTEMLPVLFYIHGGGFIEGSGSYNGADYFMDEDVILVTINYRLGFLGFLDTGDGVVVPNNGIRDIILALEWVQLNIESFGGDPNRVTIFGNSAGGDLVHLVMLSPAAKGLVHGVVAMSGNALCSWSVVAGASERARKFGKKVGCSYKDTSKLIECLKSKSLDAMLQAQKEMWNPAPDWIDVPFGPTVDSHVNNPVLPDTPLNLLTGTWKNSKHVPLMVGLTEYEGIAILAGVYLSNATLMHELRRYWHERVSRQLGYLHYVPRHLQEEFSLNLKNLYFPNGNITDDMLVQLHSDFFFYRGSRLAVDFHSFQGFQVYPYIFSYRGDFSFSSDWDLPPSGATHTDDIQYLFPSIVEPKKKWPYITKGSKHDEFSKNLVRLWTSFARDGIPSASWGDAWSAVEVPDRIGEGYPKWMLLDYVPKTFTEDENTRRRLAILDSMFAEYEKPRISWRGRPELRDEL